MQEERDSVRGREIRLCSIRGSPSDKEEFRIRRDSAVGKGFPQDCSMEW
jgi:hypothetical protein